MEANKIRCFMQRYKTAKGLRDQWQSELEQAYKLFLPNRQGFSGDSVGTSKTQDLFSDCGMNCLNQFSNNIKTKLVPSGQRWAKLEPTGAFKAEMVKGNIDQEEETAVQQMLDKNSEIMFHYISNSNFDNAASESIKDMGISVGALMVQDTGDMDAPLNFIAVPSDQLAIEESPSGDIRSAWREYTLKAREIDERWPNRVSDQRLDKAIADTPEKDLNIIEGTVWNHTTGKYEYAVHVNACDKKIIFESEYDISPWVIFRWEKTPGETWGRGPALNAVHTMGVLNNLTKDLLASNAQAVNPVALVSAAGIINPHKINFNPGSRILINASWNGKESGDPVKYLTSGTNANVAQNFKNGYELDIKEAFYITQLPNVADGAHTATEYQIRQNQAMEQQNAAFTRLQRELVGKVIAKVYAILSKYNLVESFAIDGVALSVKATSPMAMYQDNMDLQGVTQYISTMVQTLGEVAYPLIQSTIDMDQLGVYAADKMGISSSIRLSTEKRMQMLEQQKQTAQAQAMAAQQQPME